MNDMPGEMILDRSNHTRNSRDRAIPVSTISRVEQGNCGTTASSIKNLNLRVVVVGMRSWFAINISRACWKKIGGRSVAAPGKRQAWTESGDRRRTH